MEIVGTSQAGYETASPSWDGSSCTTLGRGSHLCALAIFLIGLVSLVMPPSLSSADALSSGSTRVPIVPELKGFEASPIDLTSGGTTGRLTYTRAISADCNGIAPSVTKPSWWRTSQLRYFDNDPSIPKSYVIVCVTLLTSIVRAKVTQEAIGNQLASGTPLVAGSTRKNVHIEKIPHSTAIALGAGTSSTYEISYHRGPFVVWIVGNSLRSEQSQSIEALTLALAVRQYDLLAPVA